ncbi:YifB family Mg chelatase-like AAA ATPase [Hoyosella sp. YIM 151337]|uniref:YifB family Mg chelatase-like AAA ATPase n=1 Tax=Hoyosella sp. YIM 151337 TaxID=2992742 RepID=UPI0022364DCA|nr:YifB family Mg chelatase-like AAA ATPase [Hoyosella sp. YIM 151337]MCW4353940.1 YifB family Mg chelatase-like AAA ATPase [Hoyosella sp. YIM 151337]
MPLGRAYAVAVTGITGAIVEIEADVGRGLPGVHLVGLPDTTLQEARDRVRAAVVNSGFTWPTGRTTLSLSPASLPKVGSLYDAGLACAVLNAGRLIRGERVRETVLLGELALDGRLRAVNGVLPAVLAAREQGFTDVAVPVENLAEAALVTGVSVHGARSLQELTDWLNGAAELAAPVVFPTPSPRTLPDLRDVEGQEEARQAVEIAAAGAHHLLLKGPPGIGKTMLAHRLPGLLPPLTERESLEVTAIHSISGQLPRDTPLIVDPPFVAPHHSATAVSLIGGGSGYAKPGAVSLAHRGVLFLDECTEMQPRVLNALRTPIEEGEVRISRKCGVATYPARFLMVLATNPCPCAARREVDCECLPPTRRHYRTRLSRPLVDRVDLNVEMRAEYAAIGASGRRPETTRIVRKRVLEARQAAHARWGALGFGTNGEVPGPVIRTTLGPGAAALQPVNKAMERGSISARGADRALRVAWTIADLDGKSAPGQTETEAALLFRLPRHL